MRLGLIVLLTLILLLSACQAPGSVPMPSSERTPTPLAEEPLALPTQTELALPSQETPLPEPAAETPAPESLPVTETPLPPAPQPQGFPDPAGYAWQPVAAGLEKPVGLVNAGDGSNRLFVIEQKGRIRILSDGALLPQPFLDISERIDSRGSEQGLLGLAFHPDYGAAGDGSLANRAFFVNYIDKNGDTVIARFEVALDDPQQADPDSEKRLLQIRQPYENHNGGGMAFGPDGYLYLGLGDGGSGGDPQGNAQNLTSLLGKLLRIDMDRGDPYAIPPDNPFIQGGGMPEVWASGLRNPWQFSFDRLTGDLYIGDVGQSAWEEIDFLPAGSPGGANFGWNFREGNHTYEGTVPSSLALVDPIAEYAHDLGCSVTGGLVYRGSALPAWKGIYLFGDYCSGNIWGLYRDSTGSWQQALLFSGIGRLSAFGEDEAGEIYLADLGGTILRLEEK
jgi:glucose/arabinose dehydrogenase